MDDSRHLLDPYGQKNSSRKKVIIGCIVSAIVIVAVVVTVWVVVYKDKESPKTPVGPLEDTIKIDDLMWHIDNLQSVALLNNNTRAAGTSGYQGSVNYVHKALQDAGYNATIQVFQFPQLTVVAPPQLVQVSPSEHTFVYQRDFAIMGPYNAQSNITANVTFVPSLGCTDADYANFVAGNIAVVIRGVCTFVEKVAFAAKFQAAAVIVYNDGQGSDRVGLFNAAVADAGIPAFSASYAVGTALQAELDTPHLNVYLHTVLAQIDTYNIIADTAHGRADRVIVVGSHLDSVPAGPGLNDNGSGSSLNLQLALLLSNPDYQNTLKNKIRFAWWGAEELGLLGSTFYMNNLNLTNQAELANIAVNLNFDMVASPNFFRGVYNGSSDTKSNGSGVVQTLFNDFFQSKNIEYEATAFTGRSDYGPFLTYGKPAGGLFTGAEVVKGESERELYGGIANAPFDPCYHQRCDSFLNINRQVFLESGQAAAHVLYHLATSEDLAAELQLPPHPTSN